MRALVESLRSLAPRDLVALAIEIGVAALLFAGAAGAAQIGAALIDLTKAGGL